MMKPETWSKVRDIVGRALDLAEGERELFVMREAAGDLEVQREAMSLLAGDADSASQLIEDSPLLRLFPTPGGRFGEFVVGNVLGSGQSSTVFFAQDRGGRPLALKIFRWFDELQLRGKHQLEREIEALQRVKHPGVPAVVDFGTIGGQPYLAMDFVDGPSLRKILEDARVDVFHEVLDLRDPRRVARAVVELLDALDHVHAQGIVHRDVKPENVLITKEGAVRLVDFGIARASEWTSQTRTGHAVGTVFYMSPEQARRLRHVPDPRSDLFSVGSVFYELLTLNRAFDGEEPMAVLDRILNEEPVPIESHSPNVPQELADACRAALAKDPAHRYQSAGAFASALRAILDGTRVRLPRVPLLRRIHRRLARHPRATAAAGAFAFATLLFVPPLVSNGRFAFGGTGRGLATLTIPAHDERDGTSIEVRVFDQSPFRWRTLHTTGPAPFAETRLDVEPCQVWTRVVGPNPSEDLRCVAAGEEFTLLVAGRSPSAPRDDMVLIPGRAHTVRVQSEGEHRENLADVADFLIDRQPVTNAQFHRFLVMEGHQVVLRQSMWNAEAMRARRADWDELPAVFVTLEFAEAYAAWCGKRLPTLAEAQVAMLWTLEQEGIDWTTVSDRALEAQFAIGRSQSDVSLTAYLENAAPVDPRPAKVHALGNVWLMTATPGQHLLAGRQWSDFDTYCATGYSYAVRADYVRRGRAASFAQAPRHPVVGIADHGFRCVRSRF